MIFFNNRFFKVKIKKRRIAIDNMLLRLALITMCWITYVLIVSDYNDPTTYAVLCFSFLNISLKLFRNENFVLQIIREKDRIGLERVLTYTFLVFLPIGDIQVLFSENFNCETVEVYTFIQPQRELELKIDKIQLIPLIDSLKYWLNNDYETFEEHKIQL